MAGAFREGVYDGADCGPGAISSAVFVEVLKFARMFCHLDLGWGDFHRCGCCCVGCVTR